MPLKGQQGLGFRRNLGAEMPMAAPQKKKLARRFFFLFVFTWERDVMLRHTLERLDAALHEPGPASARSEAVDKGLQVLLSRACCVRGARRLQQPPCASLFRLY